MARFAFVFDLAGAGTAPYPAIRDELNNRGWNVSEQRSYYLAPEGHGLVQCMLDLHAAVVRAPALGRNVNSAHLVEFTEQNDVAAYLAAVADALP